MSDEAADESGGPTSRRRALGVAAAGVLTALLLSLLYWQAEAVSPQRHHAYALLLRELGEADAQADAELLANRLELSRNYDALTAQLQRARRLGEQIVLPPEFLADDDRRVLVDAANKLRQTLAEKATLIDGFERGNAVLRNSRAYFPFAGDELLAVVGDAATGRSAEHYMRQVLAYAQAPDREHLIAVGRAEFRLLMVRGGAQERARVDTLLRHGRKIVTTLKDVDRATTNAFELQSGRQLEVLNREYVRGYDNAWRRAGYFRAALYTVTLTLTVYLAYLFFNLDRTRRRLTATNRQLQERYLAQQRAEERLRLHATAFDNAYEGMTLTDADGAILEINPAFSRITGYERSEVIGRNPRVLKSGRHDQEFYAAMWRSILGKGNWRGEIWNRGKYGDVYPELLSISAVRDGQGQISNFVAVFSDISRLKEQEQQLTQMAYFDALTELPNRVLLVDRMTLSAAQSRRNNTLMAVCYLDLDGFKSVNDTWGHEIGDLLLVEMAARLKSFIRGGDTVARLGGDEFVLLLVGMNNVDECERAVERMLAVIAQPLHKAPQPVGLSASVGMTIFPFDDGDVDALLRHADQVMYRAKQSGKNCYLVFDPVQDRHTRSRYDHLARIHEGLQAEQFVLHYQPVVDIRRGRLVGAEALLRWQHPQRGLVAPDDFLPLTEDTDLTVQIGEWVIKTALQQMQRWHLDGHDVPVSINLSGHHLQTANFIQRLDDVLAAHPNQRGRLQIEVLETAAIEDVVKVSQVIEQCRALDVSFAIDDFGTGYSSLTYLKRLPVTTIKIDRSFVGDMLGDANNLVIVQGILGLAKAFQRRVIAEGVETADQGRMLMQLGCDLAQGFSVARAMPGDELIEWAANWQPDPLWREIAGLRWEAVDYPMLVAEVELRNWVTQITYTVREGQPLPHQCLHDSHHCAFGRWHDGSDALRYSTVPEFLDLAGHHERLHAIVAEIDRDMRDGRHAQARARISQLIGEQDAILTMLRALQLAVAKLL
jgi:diguanylate cyclase (GGDEF)-like protein/PAS domain S-box-containing protein